ncbi:MAG: CDP-diacylglycerol--glycerol-3-phosphate 3-phosphatidyltransferase [Halothiobacillaceae bacterium]|nr:MAG: CDP-diacylglycerol--glycerol-3-phosphate 3-phosphatidyltransferase [Halothiobacillaceae bacterium]
MILKNIPNFISVVRIFLVAPVVILLLEERYGLALLIFAIAGVSDALDGYLAKRFNWTSHVGSILDPMADKLLLVCSYFTLAWLGHIPVWLVATVIARDVIIVVGAMAFYWLVGRYEMEPSWFSKINTFTQIVLVLAVVASLSIVPLGESTLDLVIYMVLVSTVISGADYVWTWGRLAWRIKHRSRD